MMNAVNIHDNNSATSFEGVETELASNLRRVERLQNLFSSPVVNKQSGQKIVEQAQALLAEIATSLSTAGGALTE